MPDSSQQRQHRKHLDIKARYRLLVWMVRLACEPVKQLEVVVAVVQRRWECWLYEQFELRVSHWKSAVAVVAVVAEVR